MLTSQNYVTNTKRKKERERRKIVHSHLMTGLQKGLSLFKPTHNVLFQQQIPCHRLLKQWLKISLRITVNSSSLISHRSFVALWHGIAPHISVLSQWSVTRRINDNHGTIISLIQQQLNSGNFICMTADAWCGFKKRQSFMGVTARVLTDKLK